MAHDRDQWLCDCFDRLTLKALESRRTGMTADAVHERYGLLPHGMTGLRDVRASLRRLEARGVVFRGRPTLFNRMRGARTTWWLAPAGDGEA